MKRQKNTITKYLLKYSYSARRKRDLIQFHDRIQELRNMDKEELDFEYINVKTEYEHQKNMFSLFVITILISILTNTWKAFLDFMRKALEYSAAQVDSEIIAQVSFEISVIILIAIMFIVLRVLFERTKMIKTLRTKLLIIEIVREESVQD